MNTKLNYKAVIFIVSLLYLLLVGLLEGLKVEHWAIVGFYNLCLWSSPKSRKFILAFTVFVIFGIIYDLMKVYPNYKVNSVDVASIYHFEKGLFGFLSNGVKVTPNEYFALHHSPVLDFITGLFYVNWMPVPLAFGIWLLFKDKGLFLRFSIAFLFVNLIGFCIYYIHPAAPPWYVAKYGFDLHLGTGGETAGLARFDEMVHAKIFGSIYSRNSNVFAAMPSLHCSYPVVVLFYAIKSNMKWMRYFFVIFMLGIWFSAIYSGHHYVSDAIAGISCAITGLLIFEKVLMKRPGFKRFIDRYTSIIS